jgi:hypothetical protein
MIDCIACKLPEWRRLLPGGLFTAGVHGAWSHGDLVACEGNPVDDDIRAIAAAIGVDFPSTGY